MKKILILSTILLTTFLKAQSTQMTPKEILQKSIDVSTPNTMKAKSIQNAIFENGIKREFEILQWSKNGNDLILMKYMKPARLKGNKFLFIKGGDIWAFFSKTGRKRRIASSAKKSKMQGSDFSYEDISIMSTLVDDFDSKLIKQEKFDGKKCYVLELKPKKKISYNKLLCWIDEENFATRKVEFYENNKLIKNMIQEDFKKIKGFLIPQKMVMKGFKSNTETRSKMDDIEININMDDKLFNPKMLK